MKRPEKITFGAMREMGVTGVLVYCLDCNIRPSSPRSPWPDQVRLSDIEPKLVCQWCGSRGAEVRPDFLPISPLKVTK